MEHSVESIKLAVVIGLVAIVIVSAMVIANLGKSKVSSSTESLMKATSDLDNADLAVYDGISVQGAEVISVIEKYKGETTFYINVVKRTQQTDGKPGNTLFKQISVGNLYGHAGSFENVKLIPRIGSNEKDEIELKTYIDFASNAASVDGSVAVSDCTVSESSDGYDVATKAVTGYATTYDKNWTSDDLMYIPDNKVFKGSIQRDIDGNITMITFVQQ